MSKSFYYSIIKDKDEGKSHAGTLIDIPVFVRSFSIIIGFTIIDSDDITKDVVLGMKFYKKNHTAYPKDLDETMICNYEVTCEEEAKRCNSGTKMKTFEESTKTATIRRLRKKYRLSLKNDMPLRDKQAIALFNQTPDVPKTLPKPNILYPSRLNDQKLCEKATNQMEKFFQIFQDLRFDISFRDALLLMPIFALTFKNLLMNKEKLLELAKILLSENCSAMILKKLPEKLRDPRKFLIPCDFPGMDYVTDRRSDLDASINLMPLSI
ncbi:hypothetical protein Tco_0956331 [Tanacetum coccineum]